MNTTEPSTTIPPPLYWLASKQPLLRIERLSELNSCVSMRKSWWERGAQQQTAVENLSAEVQRLQEEVATIPSNDEDYPDPRVPHLSATKRTLIPHAPPTDDGKKLDDVSEPMQLPCGDVQWIVDNGTLDRHLLAEANREAFCLQRDGVHYMVPWMSFSEERTPTPCAPQWLDTAHGTMSV